MPKLETSGYKRYWELREFQGIGADGTKQSIEGFRDMVTGKFYAPENGWNGEPPEILSGEKDLTMLSSRYRENYKRIFRHD